MAIEIKHKFQSTVPDGADGSVVRPSNWNDTHDIEMAGQRLLGRSATGTGVAQEVSLGNGLEFSSGAIVVRLGTGLTFASGVITASGYLPLGGGTMTGDLGMGGKKITNVDLTSTHAVLKDEGSNLSVGYTATPYNLGTLTATNTLDPLNGPLQYASNGSGASTIVIPSGNDSWSMAIRLFNSSGAGAISFSNATYVTGNPFDTNASSRFMIYITKVASTSHVHVVKLA